jgi:Cu-processing system permease protein
MRTIWVIARNTFVETIRERILYAIIGFSVLVIAASLLAGSVSLGQDLRVIQSFGLTAMLVFLLVVTLFVGSQMLYRETERKTIYLTLTKPASRELFYLGKFVGLCLVVAASAALMAAVYIGLIWSKAGFVAAANFWAVGFVVLEAWLIVALGMMFGSFATPVASALYSFALVLIGHSATTIAFIAERSPTALNYLLKTLYYLLPNLEKFNLRNEVVYGFSPSAIQALTTVGYFAGYTALLLLLGLLVFRKSEF